MQLIVPMLVLPASDLTPDARPSRTPRNIRQGDAGSLGKVAKRAFWGEYRTQH